jgi:hypothetical protein
MDIDHISPVGNIIGVPMANSSFAVTDESALHQQDFPDGSWIATSMAGQIVRTCDATGVKQEYSREPFTGRLAVKQYGIWTKLNEGHLDSAGTLTYRDGDVEIQKHLNGLHIHKNFVTGVTIQTDHLNRQELVKQPHGEIWKRSITDEKEVFEIWMDGSLTFRSESYEGAVPVDLDTPSGIQPLADVVHSEQNWENGTLTRRKLSFRSPVTRNKYLSLELNIAGTRLTLAEVCTVTTIFSEDVAIETSYQLHKPAKLRLEPDSRRREYPDIICVRNFVDGGNSALALRTTAGHEHIPFM